MEKFCPLGGLQRNALELSLLLVLYTVRNREFLFSREVGSSSAPLESTWGSTSSTRANQQPLPRGHWMSEAIHLQS